MSIPTTSPNFSADCRPESVRSPIVTGLKLKLILLGFSLVYWIVKSPYGKFHSSHGSSLFGATPTIFLASSRDLSIRESISIALTGATGAALLAGDVFEVVSDFPPNLPHATTQKTNNSKGKVFFILGNIMVFRFCVNDLPKKLIVTKTVRRDPLFICPDAFRFYPEAFPRTLLRLWQTLDTPTFEPRFRNIRPMLGAPLTIVAAYGLFTLNIM